MVLISRMTVSACLLSAWARALMLGAVVGVCVGVGDGVGRGFGRGCVLKDQIWC